MVRSYFTLLKRDESGLWGAEFGDYEKDCVDQERLDEIESGRVKAGDVKVIKSGEKQGDIESAIKRLNS